MTLFSTLPPQMVCRQLGFPWAVGSYAEIGAISTPLNGTLPPGSSGNYSFLVSGVQCSGAEDQLVNCPHFQGTVGNCSGQDAGESLPSCWTPLSSETTSSF